jgi:hypothetical protein
MVLVAILQHNKSIAKLVHFGPIVTIPVSKVFYY